MRERNSVLLLVGVIVVLLGFFFFGVNEKFEIDGYSIKDMKREYRTMEYSRDSVGNLHFVDTGGVACVAYPPYSIREVRKRPAQDKY